MSAVAGQIDCTSLKLAISSFFIKETGIGSNFDMWMRLLSQDCLVELDLGFGAHRHAEIAQTIPSFPQVKNLRLRALKAKKHLKLSHNYMILSKFPAVEVLEIRGNPQWDDDSDLISSRSTILSELREYTGPHEMLCIRILFPPAPLTHLTPDRCDPLSLMKALDGVQTCSSITSLTGSFNDFLDVPGFYSLFDIFPRLTELSMDVVYGGENNVNSAVVSFVKTLTLSFPPWLEHLYIHWQRFDFDEWISPVDVARLFRELLALPARCPALKSIWLESFAFLFRSRRLQDGAVDEHTARTTERIKNMRDKLGAPRETGTSWGRGR
ncbi:hypothetical protein DFH08DRAFT_355112 [Mycena albidolilacea]|uniref:Uncharacterized protein n=1 Tax=Mycena albidolilacea TaxID=1033008 RepID=A0AAD7EGD2_9AGAR|nr:hypothetical protein DFH08DRAFT_355112 [Mycena albidolilacea]